MPKTNNELQSNPKNSVQFCSRLPTMFWDCSVYTPPYGSEHVSARYLPYFSSNRTKRKNPNQFSVLLCQRINWLRLS